MITISENGWTNNELGVKWLHHFNRHTKPKDGTVGEYRLLIIDGHESHNSLEFRRLCEESKIVTLCMPPHSSHKLQPLDVGCFSPLKKAYGKEIEHLIRLGINHITKEVFLPAFQVAVAASITKVNIEGSFRGAGLVPFDPERVLSTLDVRLRTPTPPTIHNTPWESRTPSNFREFESQSALLRDRIQNHPLSSPTEAVVSLERLSKGIEMIAHGAELMRSEVNDLRKANEAASKRRARKKKRIQLQGVLSKGDSSAIVARLLDSASNEGKSAESEMRAAKAPRHCGGCRATGHNIRTCPKVEVHTSDPTESSASD